MDEHGFCPRHHRSSVCIRILKNDAEFIIENTEQSMGDIFTGKAAVRSSSGDTATPSIRVFPR
jgi:hypothetical protein